ncbi:MAG TPA: hypothetical protein ENJ17_04695 [Gammaproteobacteria bacterium]|nr:hypothetical protein [Gammaproteobacteria bacterium]
MSLEQRRQVAACIEDIGTDINQLSQSFYRHLLQDNPALSRLFTGNTAALNRKFFNMLAALKNVKHLEKIEASIQQLGERHGRQYAVLAEHFTPTKKALMTALDEHLGDAFTAELRQSWEVVFDEVAALMQGAISEAPRADNDSVPLTGYDADLLQAIGGEAVVLRIHQRFYDVIFEEPWLGKFFRGKHETTLARKQTEFMVAAFGGENRYRGDTPAFVHMHMLITEEQLEAREALLRDAIRAEGLSEEIVERWLRVDRGFWAGLVKASEKECVLKCFGQYPVVAKKPAGYVSPADGD